MLWMEKWIDEGILIVPSLLCGGGYRKEESTLKAVSRFLVYLTLTFTSSHIGILKPFLSAIYHRRPYYQYEHAQSKHERGVCVTSQHTDIF